MEPLTDRQRQVLAYVEERAVSGSLTPALREIAAHFGWKSKRAAECHILALMRKGWLTAEPGKARSLRLTERAKTPSHPVALIRLLGSIPAGSSQERDQDEGECVPVAVDSIGFKPTRNTFALRVTGDSMIGKHICDGDIAIFEHGADPRPGQIVAALIDRKNTLKTFLVKNGRPFLKAENPKYPDLVPAEELVIQGVLKALLRRAKD